MNVRPERVQKTIGRRPVVSARAGALIASALLALAPAAWAQRVMTEMPEPVRGLEVANKLGTTIPLDLTFSDEEGRTIKLGDYFGQTAADGGHTKPVVLVMMYFRCPILCPMVLEKFTKTLNQVDFTVGKDFDAVVVSFDQRDTPADARVQRAAQLAIYERPIDDSVRGGWNFLTSRPENARALADALGFPYRYLPDSGEFAHGSVVFVLTGDGKISRYFTGLNYPPRDVRFGLLEATNGRIGSVVDQFTLWCYHFDPTAGTYTMQAMRVMQLSSGVTVALLGGLIGGLMVRERRRRRGRTVDSGVAGLVGVQGVPRGAEQ
jgi:protein SCO1